MTKRFPKFANHQKATCFNCRSNLTGNYPSQSGYGTRNGAWQQSCTKCGMKTFYDLKCKAA